MPPSPVYEKGLHILCEFQSAETQLFIKSDGFRSFVDEQIGQLSLCKVGEAYHEFPGGGFTAVICLTESHISIHTWPEYGIATFDVFLSNYRQNNDEKTRELFGRTKAYFKASVNGYNELKR